MDKNSLVKVFRNCKAVKAGRFALASGGERDFYVDAKAVMSTASGLRLAADGVAEELSHFGLDFEVVAGVAEGVNNLLGGLLYHFASWGRHGLQSVLVRKAEKVYGAGGRFVTAIGLPLEDARMSCVVVEDVTTTGRSALEAVRLLDEAGLHAIGVVTVVDREEGAADLFAREGLKFRPVLRRRDLLAAAA